jgi:hypothetical protein
VSATDAGAGVDPASITALVDGHAVNTSFVDGVVLVTGAARAAGMHTLKVTVSDYQETKNMEDVGPVLPNTRSLTTRFTVKR